MYTFSINFLCAGESYIELTNKRATFVGLTIEVLPLLGLGVNPIIVDALSGLLSRLCDILFCCGLSGETGDVELREEFLSFVDLRLLDLLEF